MTDQTGTQFNPLIGQDSVGKVKLKSFVTEKHPKSICIVNYKGGVGKTTLSCLLGYYVSQMAEQFKKGKEELKKTRKVLLLDIDPQCSLSLAVGFDPEEVNKADFTLYNLVKPSKWTKISKTKFEQYIQKVPDTLAPSGLYIIPGSFDVDDLDMEIAKSIAIDGDRRRDELFLYCKQMIYGFKDFEYVIVDCPPNKMFLTQAMLRACSFYIPITIPDQISIYGMPRLMRWVKQIPTGERPLMLGYILNAINRTGGAPGGKVYSQQIGEADLLKSIRNDLMPIERQVFQDDPMLGQLPRLDRVAKFLSERGSKFTRFEFDKQTSGQPTIEQCVTEIVRKMMERITKYNAKA
jgi:cellulose biosynthesis protein BcsQ